MKQRYLLSFSLLLILVIVISACGGQATETPEPTAVVEATEPSEPTETPLSEPIHGLANVESVEVLILESFPVQINLIIQGNLPNGCAEIDKVVVEQEGNNFNVAVTTIQEPDQVCTEALVPFEEIVPLDVLGLEAGTYTVTINDVETSFTLDVDNVIQEEPTPEPEPTAAEPEPGTLAISGRVWHDLCAPSPDEAAEPPEGCIVTSDGVTQGNGLLEDEPGIEGIRLQIGEGSCPAAGAGLAISDADGAYSFEELNLGTYCVSVDLEDEQNLEILSDGIWTTSEEGLPEATITLDEPGTVQTVNFGWDYLFLPAPEVDLATCTNSFEFLEDLNIPDDSEFAPGTEFTKSWLLRNNGTCPWSSQYSVLFVGGDLMSAEESQPLPQPVSPGQNVEISIDMVAPDEFGTYRGNWQIADASGEPFGINGFIEDAFWLRIVVAEEPAPVATPLPNSGTIGGVVWDDFCLNSDPGQGCVEFPEESGIFIGNGTFDTFEAPLVEITISLASDACPTDGSLPAESAVISTVLTDEDGLYRFENLDEGSYCIFMDALSEENVDFLIPGNWTWPATGVGRYSFILDPGEQALDLDFGWDFVE